MAKSKPKKKVAQMAAFPPRPLEILSPPPNSIWTSGTAILLKVVTPVVNGGEEVHGWVQRSGGPLIDLGVLPYDAADDSYNVTFIPAFSNKRYFFTAGIYTSATGAAVVEEEVHVKTGTAFAPEPRQYREPEA